MTIRDSPHTTQHTGASVGQVKAFFACTKSARRPATLIMPGASLTHIWPSRWPEIERKKAPEIYLVMTAPPDKKTGQPARLIWSTSKWATKWPTVRCVLSITRPAALLIFVHTQYARLLFSFYLTHSRRLWRSTASTFIVCQCFSIRLLFFSSSNCSFCLVTQTACTKHLHLPKK